jgi:hypothetical protein
VRVRFLVAIGVVSFLAAAVLVVEAVVPSQKGASVPRPFDLAD